TGSLPVRIHRLILLKTIPYFSGTECRKCTISVRQYALILAPEFMLSESTMEAQNEKMVNNGEAVICTEHFGSSDNPAILLIAGATVSMLYWDADFCRQL